MALAHPRLRVPLSVQVGAVAALFIAALVVLWTTGSQVVARERRRAESRRVLNRAGTALAEQGSAIVAREEGFPYFTEERTIDDLDDQLSARSAVALAGEEGVDGGYFLLGSRRFFGTFPRHPQPKHEKAKHDTPAAGRLRSGSRLPPVEADLIDIQVDAAIRKQQVLFAIETIEERRPVTVAIRTAPIRVRGGVAGATWVMTRLVDPPFVDRSFEGYRLAAGLALGGIALAFVLMAGLARTVRAQVVERARLQGELRRSERLAALGKLLAGVAHEVRNPLAGIRSTVQLWERGFDTDAESISNLHEEVDRLEGIVARLLQFSRADAQELVPGDLNAVVAEAARLTSGPAEQQRVRLELALDPALPAVAMAPPALLQVLRNLTSNALQAMPDTGTLWLSTRFHAAAHCVEVSVADTGAGLSAEVLSHLFEPFYTTKPAGTGLGLAIAREIALAHHGELSAGQRADGPGAVFTLTLPVAAQNSRGGPRS